ncbi:probable UDP-sugar transporter protein SLC35A4 [Pimephales promelas]|uniref:probable UDP-sugar transporter protein SLC35A4 n=1 Tax=Pimephales promelas TaxID=90988 RepID=UPI0019557FC3|nr:probable UDP-sugar transporter protein SLC35A4 [Pimephales promelas]
MVCTFKSMIAVNNVGSPEAEPPLRSRWVLLLLLLILIYGSHAPLISLTKVDGQVPFSPSSCVVLIELAKLLVSFASLLASGNLSALKASVSVTTVTPYAVPAVLYAFNNNLVVFMQAYMDPSSFQVLSNLKIVSTALLYTSCLGKRLRRGQWFALGMLVGAGVSHSYSGLDREPSEEDQSASRLHITSWGLLLVLVYCFISGLAAVYTERVLKTQRLPLSLQNLFLYVFGVAINLASHVSGGGRQGFLEGFSPLVWLIIAGQVANGLLMSVIMKHGTGITRLFVISSSMLVNGVLSWGLLGIQLTPYFLFPVVLIGWAVYLYYM